jgi:hypothetical protein
MIPTRPLPTRPIPTRSQRPPIRPNRPPVEPVKHTRYLEESPWMVRMTLCIAAACQFEGDPRIVVCSDWRADAEYTGSETFEKQNVFVYQPESRLKSAS